MKDKIEKNNKELESRNRFRTTLEKTLEQIRNFMFSNISKVPENADGIENIINSDRVPLDSKRDLMNELNALKTLISQRDELISG